MSQKSQKGSLLIEVLAVIALIALITPVLFRQVKRRNEEILDAIRFHHSSNNIRNMRKNIYMEILKESDDEC